MINEKHYLILLALSLISYTGISQNPQLVERVNEPLQVNGIFLQEKVLNDARTISIADFRTDATPQLLSNAQAILRQLLPIKKDDELQNYYAIYVQR